MEQPHVAFALKKNPAPHGPLRLFPQIVFDSTRSTSTAGDEAEAGVPSHLGSTPLCAAAMGSADLVLKPACESCSNMSDLYGTGCKHTTLCSTCGKSMARSRARCLVCSAPITKLIRVLEPSLHQLGQAPMVAAGNQTVLLLHQLSLAGPRPPYQSEPKSVVG
jgi:hypothetical protein